jgi:DNA-binding MarR family transcriptional regulator
MDVVLELLRVQRMLEGHLSVEFGAVRLAPLHAQILVILLRDGPSTFRRLESRLGCADSTLSSAVRRLEDRGCVKRLRDPAPGTTEVIALTRPGRLLAQWAWSSLATISWRLGLLAEQDGGRAMKGITRAADDALRDRWGRAPNRRRSHRRREDPLLD